MHDIETSNWQARIDKQPIQPTPAGTLHVTGDVDTRTTDAARLIKKEPQGINPRILMLEVKVGGIVPAESNPQEVRYKEELLAEKPYDSVEIYNHNNRIATIEKIEEVH